MDNTMVQNTKENNFEKATAASKVSPARYIAVTGMLSAIAFVLMLFELPALLMPNFIKFDVSELPALIATFALGPVSGVIVCFLKNVLNVVLTGSTTGMVGEFSNFILGASFVLPAGLIYKAKKCRKNAIIGSIVGAFVMGIFSIISNYFIVYPIYYNFMPEEVVLAAYQVIVDPVGIKLSSMLQCLICFNAPFTFVKGLVSVLITMVVYKQISPLLKGRQN